MIIDNLQEDVSPLSFGLEKWSMAPKAPDLALKRIMDVVIASMSLILLLPFLLCVAAMIRLTSPGPALFRQVRWGRDQRPILICKFRTMYACQCDVSGVNQTVDGDPRITPVGAFLRRSNIDELPQLLNVLLGDMSLVGPRCHAIGMLAANVPYETLVPEYHKRHAMRPGLTGLAQMRGLRGPTIRPAKARARIAADLRYIEKFSIWLDLKIIAGTIRNEFIGGRGF